MPPSWVNVGRVEDFPPGRGHFVMGPFDKPMALFNVDGAFYALNFVCPHMGGPLAAGKLDGYVVACPWHGWTFDVRTGGPDHPGGHWTHAYRVRVEDGAVLVGWLKRDASPGPPQAGPVSVETP